jgi:hypothetical protein
MRIIAPEGHIATPDMTEAWRKLDPQWQAPSLV